MEIVDKQRIPWSIPDFGEDEREAIHRVVDSGWMTMGKETSRFEKLVAEYTGKKHNIAFNSGTGAITAALLAHNSYLEGYSVRIPAYTFKATENAVYASGLTKVKYGDVDKYTGLMTEKESKDKYEIQVPVHFAGLPINQQVWGEVPYVVEDAAESFGSTTRYTGDVSGDRLVCYSFHAAKLVTMIEGGLVATDSDELAYKLRAVRCHGENPDKKGDFICRGFNFKPLDICSAVGCVQLGKVDKYIENRNNIARIYKEIIGETVEYQHVPEYVDKHSYMMFPVFTYNPVRLATTLRYHGVDTRLGWKPLHDKRPNSEWIYRKVICLPMYNTMSEEEAEYVAYEVRECLQ